MSSTSGVGSNRGPVTTSQPAGPEVKNEEPVTGKSGNHSVSPQEGRSAGVNSGSRHDVPLAKRQPSHYGSDSDYESLPPSRSSSTSSNLDSLDGSLTFDDFVTSFEDFQFSSSDLPEEGDDEVFASVSTPSDEPESKTVVQEVVSTSTSSVTLAQGGGVAKASTLLHSLVIEDDSADAAKIKEQLASIPKKMEKDVRRAVLKQKLGKAFDGFVKFLKLPVTAAVALGTGITKLYSKMVDKSVSSGISENQASELAADEIVDGFHNPAALIKKMESEGLSTEAKEFKESIDLSKHSKIHSFENELLEDINKHPDTYPGLAGLPEPEKKLVARAAMGAAGIADLTRRPNNQLRLKSLSGDEALCSMAKLDHLMSILETQHATGVMLKLREYEKLNNYPFDELSWYGNVSSNIGDMGIFDDETGFASLEESPVVQREEFSNDVRGKLVAMQTNFQEELNKVKGDLGSMERMAEAAMVYAGVADYKGTSVNDGIQYKATQDLQGLRDVLSQLLKVLHRDDWAGGDTLFSLSELVDTLQEAKKVKATDIQQWWEYTVATRKSALDQVADQRYEQAVDEYIDKKLD